MTEAQYLTLKNDILADGTLATAVTNLDDPSIVAAYNATASPNFWVFKTSVPPSEYKGAGGLVWTEVDALSVGKARIFEWMTGNLTLPVNAADANQRQGIADAFAGATTTLANLGVLRRRLATRFEKLLATGTGSTGSPATMAVEGLLTTRDIAHALRNAPL